MLRDGVTDCIYMVLVVFLTEREKDVVEGKTTCSPVNADHRPLHIFTVSSSRYSHLHCSLRWMDCREPQFWRGGGGGGVPCRKIFD